MKHIYLRRGKAASLQRFHPWIFSGAIERIEQGVTDGEVVQVLSYDGDFLAVGHYERGSIAVRVLSFEPCDIDAEFWKKRLTEAFRMRKALGLINSPTHSLPVGREYGRELNDVFRLVHGEGDQLPGLIVDVYGSTAVMQAHSAGMHRSRQAIAEAIVATSAGSITSVYYKSEGTLPFMLQASREGGLYAAEQANSEAENAKSEAQNYFLIGNATNDIATETGLRFHIDWLHGQKTGFFVDQRENRRLLEHYAAGRDVLNMFCYTGGFSVYALRGGAQSVHSVDSSAKAMELTAANVKLNFPDDTRHTCHTEDAFKFLDNIGRRTDFDLIVLDPPAFAKHRDAVRSAIKGYTRLNAIAFDRIRPGGILFTFSCSQAVSKEQFRLAVFTAAARSGRHVRILHQLHQPADHPVSIYHPEGEYLKGLVLYVE